jgi:putative tricarboxylic transport membrane protein
MTVLFTVTSFAFGRRALLADLAHRTRSCPSSFICCFPSCWRCHCRADRLKAVRLRRSILMDSFYALMQGFALALTPAKLMYAGMGVLLGTAVGVLPGIGPAVTVALLLPVTFKLDPSGSLIMFAGIYYGAMYGGSTTSILINTPGESASMATSLEGSKMAKSGRAGPALATSAIGSFIAGIIATAGIAFLAPWMVKLAVQFGPEDYFALMVLAFVTVSATFGDSPLRGMISLFLGLALGLIGIDKLTGQSRLTFGLPELLDGVEVTTLAVGLFAIGEALYVASQKRSEEEVMKHHRLAVDDEGGLEAFLGAVDSEARSSAFPSAHCRRAARKSRPFSVIRPKSASPSTPKNGARWVRSKASRAGGSQQRVRRRNARAAALARPARPRRRRRSCSAGSTQFGLQPGPLLFAENPQIVWTLIASLFIANVMLVILNLPLVGLWVQLLKIPTPWLYAGILMFAAMGSIATKGSVAELLMLIVFGIIGFLMRRHDYPVAPMVVGLILGPMAESQLRRALQISIGDPLVLVQSPIAVVLLLCAAAAFIAPYAMNTRKFAQNED